LPFSENVNELTELLPTLDGKISDELYFSQKVLQLLSYGLPTGTQCSQNPQNRQFLKKLYFLGLSEIKVVFRQHILDLCIQLIGRFHSLEFLFIVILYEIFAIVLGNCQKTKSYFHKK
jgi:hypothetical protein